MIRFCPKCQIETERNKGGACKPCARVVSARWYKANRDKAKTANAVWYKANPDRAKVRKAAWRKANPERVAVHNAAWRKDNPDKAKAATAAWVAANSERAKALNAAYRAANPEACRIYKQNRRARKRANGGALSKDVSERLFKLQKGKCPCCGQPLGGDFHLDHIVPISKGGANEDWNIQLLRSTCNLNKSTKDPVNFMQSRGFLI